MFHEFAQGQYSLKDLAQLSYSWGLKGKTGKPLSKSAVQRILTNPFYMGIMLYGGKRYKGVHKKMINTGTFLQVQKVLKQRGKPEHFKKERKYFPFTGMMTCGECGCSITAELQKGYTYYRCTKKRGECSQKKYMRSDKLEEQIAEVLNQISIDEEIFALMLEALKLGQKEDHDTHLSSIEFWQAEQRKIAKKRKSLLEKFVDGKIDEVDFEDMKNEIDVEMSNIEDNLEEIESVGKQWLEQQKNLAITCYTAHLVFSKGTDADKKAILHSVGSNFILKDGKLSWDWIPPFDIMAKNTSRSDWR